MREKCLLDMNISTSYVMIRLYNHTMKNLPSYTIQKRIDINKDTVLTRINFSNNHLWLVNTYLHGGTISKIQKLFGTVQSHVPVNEISQLIMIRDFKINLKNRYSDIYILLEKLWSKNNKSFQ